MIYYTADLHFGHSNVIKLCSRPFSLIEKMDETLIANWNAKVHNGDINGFVPVSFDELLANNTAFKQRALEKLNK